MALFKQTVHPNKVNEINKAGKHLKVINSQTELDIRVFNLVGELILSTKVRAGFEITLPVFAKVVISAEQEQKIEMWVDENPLGYNAPTANANSLSSFKGLHYGDSEEILPFEPSRLSAKIVSDQPWWYGGANVDSDNGIPVAAGEIAEIRGAAQIFAAITAQGEYRPNNQEIKIANGVKIKKVIHCESGVVGFDTANKFFLLDENGFRFLTLSEDKPVIDFCVVGSSSVAIITLNGEFIQVLNIETRETKLIKIPEENSVNTYISRPWEITHCDGKYILSAICREPVEEVTFWALAVYSSGGWTYKLKKTETNRQAEELVRISDTVFTISKITDNALYFIDVSAFDDIAMNDYSYLDTLQERVTPLGGLNNISIMYHDNYALIHTNVDGGWSSAFVVNADDLSVIELGKCDAANISESGVLLLKDGEFHSTKDLGNTYKVEAAPRHFGSFSENAAYFYKGKFYVISSELVALYVTEKIRETPKQNFRVLKAYS